MADFEGGEVAVVDAGFEGVGVDGFAEVGVGVGVLSAFWGGGEAELDGWGEVVEDAAPGAFVGGSAAMAFVDDDEVEEVGGVVVEFWGGFGFAQLPGVGGHEGLEDGEEDAAVFGDATFFADFVGVDAHKGVFGKGTEGVVGLVGKDVTIGQKQYPRVTLGLLAKVPAALEEFPGELEGDEGFACACGHGEEDAGLALIDGFEDVLDRVMLVVAGFPGATAIFKGDKGKTIAPEIFLAEGEVPECFGGGVLGDVGFGSGLPIDLVDAASVGGVGEAGFEFFGVVFGLGDALGVGEVSFFGFDDSEFFAFVDEYVVGVFGGGAFAVAEEATGGDNFAANPAMFNGAPA